MRFKEVMRTSIGRVRNRAMRETLKVLSTNESQHWFISQWLVQQGILGWDGEENGIQQFSWATNFPVIHEDDKPLSIGTQCIVSNPLNGTILVSDGFSVSGFNISSGEQVLAYGPEDKFPDNLKNIAAFRYRAASYRRTYERAALAPADTPPVFTNVGWEQAMQGRGSLAFLPACFLTANAVGAGLPAHLSGRIMESFYDIAADEAISEWPPEEKPYLPAL